MNNKEQWHFGPWDFFAFLTVLICFTQVVKSYFNSKKRDININLEER